MSAKDWTEEKRIEWKRKIGEKVKARLNAKYGVGKGRPLTQKQKDHLRDIALMDGRRPPLIQKKPDSLSVGYVSVKAPMGHPNAGKKGYIGKHILIMEKHLGRLLKKGEIVHHIDGNCKNNRINNLMLFPSHSAHMKYHCGK